MREGGKMWWMYIRWMNMKTVSTFPDPSGGGTVSPCHRYVYTLVEITFIAKNNERCSIIK